MKNNSLNTQLSIHAKQRLKERYNIEAPIWKGNCHKLKNVKHITEQIYVCEIADTKVYPIILNNKRVKTFLTEEMFIQDTRII